jgi:hypothetical protein
MKHGKGLVLHIIFVTTIALIPEEDGRKTFPKETKLWKFSFKALIYECVTLHSFTTHNISECRMLQHSNLR